MKQVKILKTFYVNQSGITYYEGEEVEVSDQLTRRHVETGFLEIKTKSDKNKDN